MDEYGALRHRIVELCPVGALARMLFAYFHVIEKPVPSFEPSHSDQGFGEYGRREWYEHVLFYGDKDVKTEMSYDSGFPPPSSFHLSSFAQHAAHLQITTSASASSTRPITLTSPKSPMLAETMVQ